MVVHDPGDAQRAKHTSPTHNQHDSSKDKALEGANGPNRKEIGAKPIKQDQNSEFAGDLAVAADARKMAREENEQAKEEADAELAQAMELEMEANYSSNEEDDRKMTKEEMDQARVLKVTTDMDIDTDNTIEETIINNTDNHASETEINHTTEVEVMGSTPRQATEKEKENDKEKETEINNQTKEIEVQGSSPKIDKKKQRTN